MHLAYTAILRSQQRVPPTSSELLALPPFYEAREPQDVFLSVYDLNKTFKSVNNVLMPMGRYFEGHNMYFEDMWMTNLHHFR